MLLLLLLLLLLHAPCNPNASTVSTAPMPTAGINCSQEKKRMHFGHKTDWLAGLPGVVRCDLVPTRGQKRCLWKFIWLRLLLLWLLGPFVFFCWLLLQLLNARQHLESKTHAREPKLLSIVSSVFPVSCKRNQVEEEEENKTQCTNNKKGASSEALFIII